MKGRYSLLYCQVARLTLPLGSRKSPQINHSQGDAQRRLNNLGRLAILHTKCGAQDFMTLYYCVEASLECLFIHREAEANGGRHIIHSTLRLQLVKEPEALLGEGSRKYIDIFFH